MGEKPVHGVQSAALGRGGEAHGAFAGAARHLRRGRGDRAPFYVDYGKNICIGRGFYANHNLVILDGATVTIGNNVFIGPNCTISTAGHPFEARLRNEGLEYAKSITIGSNVWIGMGVQICPGVTIGDNAVIGAGSVVTKDVPAGWLAYGNPCAPVKAVEEKPVRRIL